MTDSAQQQSYDQLLELSKLLSSVNRELQGSEADPTRHARLKAQRAALMREIDELCEHIRTSIRQ